ASARGIRTRSRPRSSSSPRARSPRRWCGATLPRRAPRARPQKCSSTLRLLDVDRERARRNGGELEAEVDPADLAPVGGLDLHFPVAGLVFRLEAVAAEAFGGAAGDLGLNRVVRLPAVLL